MMAFLPQGYVIKWKLMMVMKSYSVFPILHNCIQMCFISNRSMGEIGHQHTAISIYLVGSKPQAYNTRPKGNMGS